MSGTDFGRISSIPEQTRDNYLEGEAEKIAAEIVFTFMFSLHNEPWRLFGITKSIHPQVIGH